MQAVIMVGGMGVRLRPFTYAIPKPLLPFKDKTILEYMVKFLSENGFDEIFLLTLYQHEKFNQCYDYKEKYGIDINICYEEEKRGTVGGISIILDRLDSNFLVLNGDLIIETDLNKMFNYHMNNKADITVGVTDYHFTVPYGVVESDNNCKLLNIIEKPRYSFKINSGIYILNSAIFDLKDNSKYLDMPTLIHKASGLNRIIKTYDIGPYWLDIGQLNDYERAVDKIEEWERQRNNTNK